MENKSINGNNTTTMSENIWYPIYDKNGKIIMAQKTSDGVTITVPATTEILKTIKKQMEANEIAKKIFEKVSVDNENIIAYLYLLLDQYINFLESKNLDYLINMMKRLEESNHIDTNNISFINRLRTTYSSKDNEGFNDVLEQFELYNMEYFSGFYITEQSIKSH